MKQKFLHASVGVRLVTIFHKRPVVNNQFVVAEISCFQVMAAKNACFVLQVFSLCFVLQ